MNVRDYRRYGFDTNEPLIGRETMMRSYLDKKFSEVGVIDYEKIKESVDLSGLSDMIDKLKEDMKSGLSGLVIDYERLEQHVTESTDEQTKVIVDAIKENQPDLCCVAHKCDIANAVDELKAHTHIIVDKEIKPQFQTIYEQLQELIEK